MIDLNTLNGKRKFYYNDGVEDYEKLGKWFDVGVVRGCYINRGGLYGDSCTIIITYLDNERLITKGVNLPKHQLKNIERILDDDETIDVINGLGLSVKPVSYIPKGYKKECYTLEWVNTPKELRKKIEDSEVNF